MINIRFYDYGIEDILTGRKHSTLRFGEDQFQEGSIIGVCRNSGERVGLIHIQSKSKVRFRDLTRSDARIENWRSLDALKMRLLHTYPNLRPESVLTRYRFAYLPNLPRHRQRGGNIDLIRFLPQKISIATTSAAKMGRYTRILADLPVRFSKIMIESNSKALESRNDPSAESRAAMKALSRKQQTGGFCFATDDMGILEIGGSCHAVPNLGSIQDDFLSLVRDRAQLTIRTAIAISFKGHCNTTVVYRSFWWAPRKDADSLNSTLFLQRSGRISVADLPMMHPVLVDPLKQGVMDCLTGRAP